MTNHWIDLKNANAHLIMGSNAVENHPIASYHIWKAKEENEATIIHVDPRYTRTSAKADMYAPIRSGTDIVFLGGMVRWMIEKWIASGYTKYINNKYVEDCTNALFLVRTDCKSARTAPTGTFTAGTWDYQYGTDYDPSPGVTPKIKTPLKAANLTAALSNVDSVFYRLREHYSVYTPQMVQKVCGTPSGLFEEICEAYCGGTYADDKAGTILYAMGWTQHTVGTQNIRAATLVQTLLGNIGVAGGGVDALRGWHNVQGATDHGFLMQYIPGYLALPQATADYATLGTGPLDVSNTYLKMQTALAMDPDAPTGPQSSNWWGGTLFATQYNRARYTVSLLRAWWPSLAASVSYDYLPKRTGDNSFLTIIDEMAKVAKPIKGLFCWGTNPAMMGPDQTKLRAALKNLDWMVVCDCFETETSSFWKAAAGVDPATINTEVYFLPGAYAYEKEGSATNSGRLAQWRDKACDPPGEAKDEVEILNDLGAAIKAADAGASPQLANLAWPVGPLITTGTLAEKVAKEINGYALVDFTTPAIGGVTTSYTVGQQINTFFHLDSLTGATACGNWLYCGTWQKTANARTGNFNQMRNRRNIDDHPKQIGIFRDWGYSWPVNRRIIYNRAAVYQSGASMGLPLNPDKQVVSWNPAGPNWDGGCLAGQANDVVDGFGTAGPQTWLPFIMLPEGVARLFGRGLADGPFPEHWEPKEPPFNYNPMGTSQLSSPYLTGQAGYTATYATPGDPAYPIVCTTFRLTEHWHGGGFTRNCPTQGEAQPEPFIEMSEELASSKGITDGVMVTVTSARGSIDLKACVTKRWKPFNIDGTTVHEVGLPWHWGWSGMFPGATANFLTPFIGDANTRIPETKVFMVNIALAP